MFSNERGTLTTILFVLIWLMFLHFRLFDKKIRRYLMFIGYLLIFWLLVRYLRIMVFVDTPLHTYMWYLYYVGLIFIPTIYYLCCSYLSKKDNLKEKYIVYSISLILLVLVFTNNFHEFVFKFKDIDKIKYTHNFGYILVCIWIFYLFIVGTIRLASLKTDKKIYQIVIAFIPITIGLIYTICYDVFINGAFALNMTANLSILIVAGIEIMLALNYIPNNFRYYKFYTNSNMNSVILNDKGTIIYQTKNKFSMPKQIIDDIKSGNVKDEYKNESGTNQLYRIKKYSKNYVVFKKDFKEINKLKEELQKKNDELDRYSKILEKEKNIKQELYEIRFQSEIQEKLEEKIEDKKDKIKELLERQNISIEELSKVKLWIGYCKRISSLIIDNYNKEIFNEEKLKLIIDELFEDAKMFGTTGNISINKINVNSIIAIQSYEVVSTIIDNYEKINFIVRISKAGNIVKIRFLFEENIENIIDLIEELEFINVQNIEYKSEDDENVLEIYLEDL